MMHGLSKCGAWALEHSDCRTHRALVDRGVRLERRPDGGWRSAEGPAEASRGDGAWGTEPACRDGAWGTESTGRDGAWGTEPACGCLSGAARALH